MCTTAYCHNCLVMETAYGWFQVHLPLIARIYMEKLDGDQNAVLKTTVKYIQLMFFMSFMSLLLTKTIKSTQQNY